MNVTYQNVMSNTTDFLINGIRVAVIGLSGGLEFLKNANLSIEEIEAVEKCAIERTQKINGLVQNLDITKISQIYQGTDSCCRCGCRGTYLATSFMKDPRAEVNDKLAQRRLNRAKKLVEEGAYINVNKNYINISYGNDKALCFYLNQLKNN